MANNTDWIIESKILKSRAYQNPSTINPLTKASQIIIIRALITNKNNPKVTMVTGSVNMIRIGFTNRFNKTRTAATTIAIRKLSTEIPGKILARMTTEIALSKISMMVFKDLDSAIVC